MVNIKLAVVGNLKERYLRDAFSEYDKRLKRYCNLKVCEIKESSIPENPSAGEIKRILETEGKSLLKELSGFVIALCIEGGQLSSTDFAKRLERAASDGGSRITFVIGGSHGLSEEVKNAADLKLSFSKMTFPHQLARVLLAEQLYRAFQINTNGKYHK